MNLRVFEVLEGSGELVCFFLVKNDFESSSAIVDFKYNSHGLINFVDHSSNKDNLFKSLPCYSSYLLDISTVNLNVIIGTSWGILNHHASDWSENPLFAGFLPHVVFVASPAVVLIVA